MSSFFLVLCFLRSLPRPNTSPATFSSVLFIILFHSLLADVQSATHLSDASGKPVQGRCCICFQVPSSDAGVRARFVCFHRSPTFPLSTQPMPIQFKHETTPTRWLAWLQSNAVEQTAWVPYVTNYSTSWMRNFPWYKKRSMRHIKIKIAW